MLSVFRKHIFLYLGIMDIHVDHVMSYGVSEYVEIWIVCVGLYELISHYSLLSYIVMVAYSRLWYCTFGFHSP